MGLQEIVLILGAAIVALHIKSYVTHAYEEAKVDARVRKSMERDAQYSKPNETFTRLQSLPPRIYHKYAPDDEIILLLSGGDDHIQDILSGFSYLTTFRADYYMLLDRKRIYSERLRILHDVVYQKNTRAMLWGLRDRSAHWLHNAIDAGVSVA